MKISIIVPVFNAERYLGECVDSIIASLGKMAGELLLIDNNSTDESKIIIQDYHKRYPKIIQALHCNTPGAAAVRNYGASIARGDYIWFIDADDYIAKDAISSLFKKVDIDKPDLVMMGAERVYPVGHTDYLSPVSPDDPSHKSRFVRYGMGPWQVIIRRKWWNDHNFRFREGIIHEDMELMSALILYTNKLTSIDRPLYFYRQTQNSVLHRQVWNKNAYDIFPALEGLLERFRAVSKESEYHDELEWFFIWNLLIDSAKDFAEFPEGRPGFQRSREILQKNFPNWRRNRFFREKPLKLRIRIILNYYKR